MNELVAIGGLVVAGMALWLNFGERRAKHREALYEKQVEAFNSVYAALTEVYNASQAFLVAHMQGLTDETRLEFRKSLANGPLAPASVGLISAQQKWALFLPRKVQEALVAFRTTLNGLSAPPGVEDQYAPELVTATDPQLILSHSYSRVVEVLREGLGVDPLSQEILRLVGRTPGSGRDD